MGWQVLLLATPCLALHAVGGPQGIRAVRPPALRICCAARKGFSENNRKQALAKREAARAEAERAAQAARSELERAESEKRQSQLKALEELVRQRKRREAGRALQKMPDGLLVDDPPLCEALVEMYAQGPVQQHDLIHWISVHHVLPSPPAAMISAFVISATATGHHDAALQWWRRLEQPGPECNAAATRSTLVAGEHLDARVLLDALSTDEAAAAIETATRECVDRGQVERAFRCRGFIGREGV